jgi:hypothetical protein
MRFALGLVLIVGLTSCSSIATKNNETEITITKQEFIECQNASDALEKAIKKHPQLKKELVAGDGNCGKWIKPLLRGHLILDSKK